MFKPTKNKIVPESILNGNDPIQARMIENIITIKKSQSKLIKLKSIKKIRKQWSSYFNIKINWSYKPST